MKNEINILCFLSLHSTNRYVILTNIFTFIATIECIIMKKKKAIHQRKVLFKNIAMAKNRKRIQTNNKKSNI